MKKKTGIARIITLDERGMGNHGVSFLDLNVEAGIPGDVMRHL